MTVSLQLRAGHQLTMTPFLQRSIQLLQLSSLEFQQQVQEVMTTNPFLETVDTAEEPGQTDAAEQQEPPESTSDEPSSSDTFDDLWSGGTTDYRSSRSGDDEWDPALMVPGTPTLREHLLHQAGCLRLSERDQALVQVIVEAVDASGYLTQPLEELCALCPPEMDVQADDMMVALRHVQALDPPGVAARSVAECLQLQLHALDADEHPARDLALRIVDRHLDLLAAHDFQRLQRELACEESELQAATVLLRGLCPRPGAGFGADETQFVVADVIVQQQKGKWVASINPEVIPRIHVSRFYASILKGGREGGGSPVSQQLREARWLVRNIEQRFQTIQRVAQAIVDHQSRFFDYGPMAMKPLTLGEIADKVGLHESTVSRVTSRKYMSTPRGLLEFKHFFGSHVETAAGAPCSATAVRALITELIGAEDANRPLSDIKLTRLLEQRGIKVARRTVSKYRDSLQIPSVEVRRMSHRPMA
ncbi:MAG TPA: RNA polymerase factor sigma-54 [Burkholderiaceae bacterium]|nr:RNA polymerase factor sigma-54 [Burkholderiaceae bacterium]